MISVPAATYKHVFEGCGHRWQKHALPSRDSIRNYSIGTVVVNSIASQLQQVGILRGFLTRQCSWCLKMGSSRISASSGRLSATLYTH